MENENIIKLGVKAIEASFIIIEVVLLFLLFSFFSSPVSGGIGNPNTTVQTTLNIGEVFPEILNVSINEGAETITLIPNQSVNVSCVGLIRDYNGELNLSTVSARFFLNSVGYDGAEDNNSMYRNSSCTFNETTNNWAGVPDDPYHALANCTFEIWYFATPGVWNCTMWVNDSTNFNDSNSDDINVSELLALAVPDTINYGLVNATDVSNENVTNVTNVGNVMFNLSLKGYAYNETTTANLAMNCTLGNIKNISIEHEKYNMTSSNDSVLNLGQTAGIYKNLTSSTIVEMFNLGYRTNDTIQDAINATYWRIYVPLGVAGSCQGNIIFGAVQSGASP
ncbi:hypothetical protein A3K73_05680 [Candidatus Pacearchaeota archaeon RBG_13_36_9]|nr:MAG: hypothetical protein A3K73_05680 [Candidatus Pacearchaeota archaeon RBG_13_36_9]